MTVSTEITRHSYYPGAAMADELIPFQFLEMDHVLAFVVRDTPLIAGSDYVVRGDGRVKAGIIRTLRVFASDEKLTLIRLTPRAQKAETNAFKPLPAEMVGRELDRRAFVEQEIDAQVSRSLMVPDGETGGTLPPFSQRVGLLAVFGPDGGLTGVQSNWNAIDGFDDGLWNSAAPITDDGPWG